MHSQYLQKGTYYSLISSEMSFQYSLHVEGKVKESNMNSCTRPAIRSSKKQQYVL